MNDSPVQAILGWLVLSAALASSLANGGVTPVAWAMLYLITFTLFLVQVFLDFRYGVPLQARRVLPIALLYFAAIVWLQVQTLPALPDWLAHPAWSIVPDDSLRAVSARPDLGQQVVLRLTTYAMIFWIILRSSVSGQRAQTYIKAFALFSTALAIYGIESNLTGTNLLLGIEHESGPVRASFTNRNNYATFVVFGALANIGIYIRKMRHSEVLSGRAAVREYLESFFAGGWIFALGALVCLTALALTSSRAGGVAGLIGLGVLVWSLRRRGGGGVGVGLLWFVLAGTVGFVLLTSTSRVLERFAQQTDDARWLIYPYVVDGITDRPILGHGAGAFHDTFRARVPFEAASAEWSLAHNTYLENAYEFGLPAALTFYLALALIGWRLLRGVRTRKRNQGVPSYALACFAAAAFHSIFDFSLQIPAVPATFAAILAMGWAQSFARNDLVSGPKKKPG